LYVLKDSILFCGQDKREYPWMSNFFMCKIKDEQGRVWRSSEHLYQGMKFIEPVYQEAVRMVLTPKESKIIANNYLRDNIRPDWHDIKIDIMRDVVMRKFTQNESLRDKLLKTGDKVLIEHRASDDFWGSGPDMKGKNWLGVILMETREELK